MKLKVAIVGYGNLGKALESILQNSQNYKLEKIFSRRINLYSPYKTPFEKLENIHKYKGKIDILLVSLGSYSDIDKYGLDLAKDFCTIDSFDTHAKLKNHIFALDKIAKQNKKVCLCAFGWDPGLMSLIRTIFDSIDDKTPSNCFWGKGVSQGHSDAIRRVNGVENAIQYTIPKQDILSKSRKAFDYSPTNEQKHDRLCYVALTPSGDKNIVEQTIKSMPNYFDKYNTKINFVDDKQVKKLQRNLSHKGYIFKNFKINKTYSTKMSFSLSLQSNPFFTAKIMLMGVNVVANLLSTQSYGAYSMLDVPVRLFLSKNRQEVIENKL